MRAVVCCLVMLMPGYSLLAGISVSLAQSAGSSRISRDLIDKALLDVHHGVELSRQRAAALVNEIEELVKDRKTLAHALVNAARAERKFMRDIRAGKNRLKELVKRRYVLETAFKRRRREFSEVLAGLERVGINLPPAILVRPDDALHSVRSAVLLGSVLPEMKARADILSMNLKELETIEKSAREERIQLADAIENQKTEKKRLSLLIAKKFSLQKASEENLATEQEYSRKLAEKAKSLHDLIVDLHDQEQLTRDSDNPDKTDLMEIQADFASLRGLLPLPVDGNHVQGFGKSSHGEVIETDPGAVVISPVEGIVRYAGQFRSYGKILIIDAGKGYHLVLAGLGRIDVIQGQMLLQGEPVGVMDAQLVASVAAFNAGKNLPTLYVEIRKDGKPVNPESWWTRR